MIGLRAVVVDDNALNRDLVVRVLSANGMKTAEAKDAMAGWKEIESFDPQLAVIDVMMPGTMDGVGLCRLIRSCPKYKNMAVVILTASDKRREAERAHKSGADILLSKPFSPRELWTQIELLLKGRKAPAQAPRVFILDDDRGDCQQTRAVLQRAGYEVHDLQDPAGAIAAIKNFGPDLLLLDVDLPRLSGPEFALVVDKDRSIMKKPRILFYSNHTAADLQELSSAYGVAGFACKSEGPQGLIQAVHKALTE